MTALGVSIIAEEWESYDELLRKKKSLRFEWYIVRKDETTLLTSFGNVTYHKTLFKNKVAGEYEYLLDRIIGIGKHAHMTEDAGAGILKETIQSSYQKGGENAAIMEEGASKETALKMRKLDALVTNSPEVFQCIGKTDIDKTYIMPKSRVKYRKPRRISRSKRAVKRSDKKVNLK